MFRYWRIGAVKETVRTTTIDAVFRNHRLQRVRLLKIDCEGAEDKIMNGARNVLERRAIDFIALEYHPAICGIERCWRIDKGLKALGYQLTKAHGQYIYHLPALEEKLKPLGDVRVNCDWDA